MAKVVQYVDKATGEKESLESLLSRFKKKVIKEDLMNELSKKLYFVPDSVKRREAKKARKRKFK